MMTRITTDPISGHEVNDPEHHPCIYEGDGEDGQEIYFENEENRQTYLNRDKKGRSASEGSGGD